MSVDYRVEERLRVYGVEADGEISKFAAADAACTICGVTNWFLERLKAEHRCPWIGGPKNWSRVHIDHIDPADRTSAANLRPLCYHCNMTRGDVKLTDVQVLRKARKFWLAQHPERYLTWLKEVPK